MPERPLFGDHLLREGDGTLDEVALDDFVDEAGRERVLRRNRIAAQNHRKTLFDADEPRQKLRSTGARNDAELDFRQAQPRAGRGDAEMTAERHLEPAAERRAVHGGDRRLLDFFDRGDDLGEAGRLHRLAELGDVGAGHEGAARAREHDRLDALVFGGLDEIFEHARAHFMLERVDGRIVDDDDGDRAVALHADWT